MNLMPSQVFPISFISFSTVRRHVILGRPRLRFPSISVVVFALTALIVMTAASFRLSAEFLVFSLSAFTVAHGMDSGGSFCTDDSCKLHVAVSVTKAFYMIGLLALCKTSQTWRAGRLLFVWPLTFDLSGMGVPTRTSRGAASIALGLIGARKHPQHVKVAIFGRDRWLSLRVI